MTLSTNPEISRPLVQTVKNEITKMGKERVPHILNLLKSVYKHIDAQGTFLDLLSLAKAFVLMGANISIEKLSMLKDKIEIFAGDKSHPGKLDCGQFTILVLACRNTETAPSRRSGE